MRRIKTDMRPFFKIKGEPAVLVSTADLRKLLAVARAADILAKARSEVKGNLFILINCEKRIVEAVDALNAKPKARKVK